MHSASHLRVSKSASTCPQWWLRGALETQMTRWEAAVTGSESSIKEESEMLSPICDLQSLRPTRQPKPTGLRIGAGAMWVERLFDIQPRERDRQTHRKTEKNRQTDTSTHRKTERHTKRQTQADRARECVRKAEIKRQRQRDRDTHRVVGKGGREGKGKREKGRGRGRKSANMLRTNTQ